MISLVDLERKVSEKTRVIIPVHMNGRDAHIDEVLEFGDRYKLKVIEDAAQALGSRDLSGAFLGTKSLAGLFSLSLAKVISSGHGGFITSNDDEFATRLRRMRIHGSKMLLSQRIGFCLGLILGLLTFLRVSGLSN